MSMTPAVFSNMLVKTQGIEDARRIVLGYAREFIGATKDSTNENYVFYKACLTYLDKKYPRKEEN